MLLCRAMPITRREAIGMLGTGAAAGIAGKFAGPLAAQTPPRIAFPKGAIIRTILRDLPPEELASGATCFSNICMRHPPAPPHFTDDVG